MTSPTTSDVPLEQWGHELASTRRAQGLTQRDLARLARVTQQTVSKIERGSVCPHDRLKLRLADALGVHASVLFRLPAPSTLTR